MAVQRCRSAVLISIDGTLDENAGEALRQALDHVTPDERDLLVDLRGVGAMDTDGLFHLLHLHRRAELLCLRVLVTGWQSQPQQCMAGLAGIAGPGAATGERYAVAGFRRSLRTASSAYATTPTSPPAGCPRPSSPLRGSGPAPADAAAKLVLTSQTGPLTSPPPSQRAPHPGLRPVRAVPGLPGGCGRTGPPSGGAVGGGGVAQ